MIDLISLELEIGKPENQLLAGIVKELLKENEQLRHSLRLSHAENRILMKVNDRFEVALNEVTRNMRELEEMRKGMLQDRHEAD